MTTNDKWINRIQQKMEHYEADVPEGLYDDIGPRCSAAG